MQQGDFLAAIAANTSTSVDEIAGINKLNPNLALMPGQVGSRGRVGGLGGREEGRAKQLPGDIIMQ